MCEYVFNIVARLIAAIGVIAAILINALKNHGNEKTRTAATKIAEIVENVYKGCTAAEKLRAFKALCKERKINVKKAVKFLEKYIIPTSKSINVCVIPNDTDTDTDTEVV